MNILKFTNKLSNNNIAPKNQALKYFFVLWMIITSGGIAILYNQFILTIIVNMFVIIVICFKVKDKISLSPSIFICLFILFCSCIGHLFITIVDNHVYYGGLLILEILIMCICICQYITLKEMNRIYSNIIFLIACISLVGYLFQSQLISQAALFPKLVNGENVYLNLYFYIINVAVPHRNCGIFWEPGAFQIFLNLAVAFTLFDNEVKHKMIKLMIFGITIVSTISTNGLIAFGLIFISYVVSRKIKNKFKMISMLSISTLIMLSYNLEVLIKSFEYKFGISTGIVSTNVTSRVNPFILDLMIMKKYFLGIPGVDYYAEILTEFSFKYNLPYISSSSTHTMIGAAFGIPFMIVALWGLYKFSYGIINNNLSTFFLFMAIILVFSGESFLLYPLYYLLIIYGITYKEFKIKNNRMVSNG